jgi:HlyD family type I secretion membrane fusion protein
MADTATSPRPSSNARLFLIGWSVIGLVFGGLIAWSVFAPFEGAVLASGSVSVQSRHQAVQHLEGGIVSEILVSEGSAVEAGELLLRLDGKALEAQQASLDARLTDLVAREARLLAERDGLERLSVQSDVGDLLPKAALKDALAGQRTLMRARATSRTTQVSILSQRIIQLERQIDGLASEVAARRDQSRLIEQELEGLQELLEKGLTPRPRLLALERERASLKGSVDSLSADMARTRVQIGEAQLEKLRLTDGCREEVIEELTLVQTEIATLAEERRAVSDRLSRLEIRAPRAGRVLGARAHTVGGVIAPGDPVMHIVPKDDPLVVMVRVLPQDIDKITVGQPARMRFSAFSQRETPEIQGNVLKIGADAVVDEASGLAFYEIVLALPSEQPLGERFTLVPGMPVEAMLRTESRNALSYLTKPLRDSVSRTFRE